MALFGNTKASAAAEPLHVKYRPAVLDIVIGQDPVVNSIKAMFKDEKVPHAFLFTGPSGTGKTTLARIIAKMLKIDNVDYLERDAAVYTGVDDMRQLLQGLKYRGLGKSGMKAVVLDEVHMLSKGAWNSLLKELEEPPSHLYWFLCTTEAGKVPDTIRTRCHSYILKSVSIPDLMDWIEYVCNQEKIELPAGGSEIIARYAEGSPRKALVALSQARSSTTKEEIVKVLEAIDDSAEVIELIRLLVDRGPRWPKALKLFNALKDANAETLRIQIVNYLVSCILKSTSEKESIHFLSILNNFSDPIYNATGIAQLLLAFGNVLLNEDEK